MNSSPRFNKHDSLARGESAEARFKRMARERGWKIAPATREADLYEHWDVQIRQAGQSLRVDVKGMRKIRRSDADVQDEWVWLEFHSVRPDDRGWLYDSKADLLAFETRRGFVLIPRVTLIELAEQWVDRRARVTVPAAAKYRVYQRAGRPDEIAQIETARLLPHAWQIWTT